MTLDEYLSKGAKTTSALAREVGLSPTSIWRLRHGKQMPPLETMVKIAAATGNAVTPNDFAGITA